MNQFKENQQEEEQSRPLKENKTGRYVRSFLDGSILTWENVVRFMPFIFFLTFLAIIYIANSYIAQKTFREIEIMKAEIKELRSEHISLKSELMYRSKQSEVARRLENTGLKESVVPPEVIVVEKKISNE